MRLEALTDQIAELAAAEARKLVHASMDLINSDRPVVLEAIERAAQESAAVIGRSVIAAVVNLAADDPLAGVDCPHGHRSRLAGVRTKTVRTLLGSFRLSRGYYHCGTCHLGLAPADERLGIAGTSLSPGLARACALAGAEMPYAKSGTFITTVTGLNLASASTIGRVTRSQGGRARDLISTELEAARPQGPAPAFTSLPDKCYVVMDGTGAPMLPRECEGRQGKTGERAGTREVKIGCFFTQTSCDPATGQPVQDDRSVSYLSTFEPAERFAHLVKAEYWRRGFDQIRQPIVLGDKAKWIWTIADTRFPEATQIVDYFHAREHLADLTKLATALLDDPASWEHHLIDRLDMGDTTAIATAIDKLNLDQKAPDLVKPAATEASYFTGNHHRMQYAEFLANGYYIGSGPVESACNTIVKQRAKRAGMHWTIQGLDPVLAIRTLHQSGRDHILWPTPQT